MNIGEKIQLKNGSFPVIPCKKCGHAMVNLDRDEIGVGDLLKLKINGVWLSNPFTKEPVCLDCEVENHQEPVRKARDWFHSDDTNDTPFFGGFSIGGGDSSSGNSGGGFDFGGFGGGGFSGGGASGGF